MDADEKEADKLEPSDNDGVLRFGGEDM